MASELSVQSGEQRLWVWMNGEIKKQEDAVVRADSSGLLLGQGVFTTLGIWHGQAFAVDRHLARLRRDAALLNIPLLWSDSVLEAGLDEVLAGNNITRGMARITATARYDRRWNLDEGADLLILARPNIDDGSSRHSQPLRLWLSQFRLDARRPLAGVKSTSYAAHTHIWQEAGARGFDEAVVCNSQGLICEAARANIFWARVGVLYTPATQTGCLPGIARDLVLEWAVQNRVPHQQGAFSLFDLTAADEVFLTSATSAPRAVRSLTVAENTVDSKKEYSLMEYSYETPGPLTIQLQEHWQTMIDAR